MTGRLMALSLSALLGLATAQLGGWSSDDPLGPALMQHTADAKEGPGWLPFTGAHANAIGCTYSNGCQSPRAGYHGYPAIDFTVAFGTSVHAAGPGVVRQAHATCAPRNPPGRAVDCGPARLGNMVRIEHPDGRHSWYGHLSEVMVKKDIEVTRGQLLGRVGNSGLSYGAHLHYQETTSGQYTSAVDPGAMKVVQDGKVADYPTLLGLRVPWSGVPCGVQPDEPKCTARHTVGNEGYRPREDAPPTPRRPLNPFRIEIDRSILGVPLGTTVGAIRGRFGRPHRASEFRWDSTNRPGLSLTYRRGGGDLIVLFGDGRVVSVETTAPRARTAAGIGPGVALLRAAGLPGFRFDPCTEGYTNDRPARALATTFAPDFDSAQLIRSVRIDRAGWVTC